MAAPHTSPPPIREPLLNVDNIQGNVFPGFNKPHQCFIGLIIENPAQAKDWLKRIAGEISTVRTVLDDRKRYRELRQRLAMRPTAADHLATHIGIGFSYGGMAKLTRDAQSFESDAYRLGLVVRSPLLGDPTDPQDPGNPRHWVVGGPGNVPDVLLVIGSDASQERTATAQRLMQAASASGLRVTYCQDGDVLPGGLRGHEHFGFDDNVSQPGVRGLVAEDPLEYITPRTVDPSVVPESLLYGYPGQYVIWPGEFVFGYPDQTQDPLFPGDPNTIMPLWTKDGSFLVFRRYRQDVRLFWDTMAAEAQRLRLRPGFEWVNPVSLASRVVGRWPSGAPVERVPDKDVPELGQNELANNHFNYTADTCPVALVRPYHDTFPNAKADPIGAVCPMGAHIRKVNTRDSSNDTGATLGSFTRRLMRRGLPFGAPLLEGPIAGDHVPLQLIDPLHGNRGLLFLGFMTSIEDQFEFLCNRWMSNRFAPASPSGDDVFIGLNGNYGQNRVRRMILFSSGMQQEEVVTNAPWLVPTGGGYFFTPSIQAIREVLGK